jgi:hypothetical protein
MRHTFVTVGVLWGLASVGLSIAIGVGAPEPQLAGRLYAAATAAAVLALLTARLATGGRAATEPGFEQLAALPAEDDDSAVPALTSIEQSVRFARSSAGDLHSRLRPVMREIAAHRLARHNLRLDAPAHQERVEAMLGPVLYELVRKDRPRPRERFAPGMSPESIEQAVAVLEDLR